MTLRDEEEEWVDLHDRRFVIGLSELFAELREKERWKVLVSNISGFCAKLVSSHFQMFATFDSTMTWYYITLRLRG